MPRKLHNQRNPDHSNLVGDRRILYSEEAVRIGGNRREFRRWLLEQRETNKMPLLEQLADMLTPMFQFLADGYATGNLEDRAWMLLYAVRPDLLGGETMKEYAEKRGLHRATVYEVLNKLHRHIPNLNLDLSTRGCEKGDMTERSEKIRNARLATIEKSRKRIEFLRGKAENAKKCAATKAAKRAVTQPLEAVA